MWFPTLGPVLLAPLSFCPLAPALQVDAATCAIVADTNPSQDPIHALHIRHVEIEGWGIWV